MLTDGRAGFFFIRPFGGCEGHAWGATTATQRPPEPIDLRNATPSGSIASKTVSRERLRYRQPTGPYPLHHRDDQVDRPSAMGV